MENHCKSEHGVGCKFTVTEDEAEVKTKLKKRGQTVCSNCGESYNNRSRTEKCKCGHNLCFGKQNKNTFLNPVPIGELFSVRKNKSGINKRVIVNF